MTQNNPRHYPGDLEQMQSLPLEAKIIMTQRRIREWYDAFEGQVYVSFSGGKDSTVLLHIARQIYPDIPAVFCDTGLEYPEIKDFVSATPGVTVIRPQMSFRQVIQTYGYPVISKESSLYIHYARKAKERGDMTRYEYYVHGGRVNRKTGEYYKFGALSKTALRVLESDIPVSDQCCYIMKKSPFKKYQKENGVRPILATMAQESRLRYNAWLKHGCNAFDIRDPKSAPMSFWTEQDVLLYLREYSVPYCPVYGEIVEDKAGKLHTTGCDRTGCMFCMFGVHREKEPNRFQRMMKTHPQIYSYCMKPMENGGLGLAEVLDFIGVKH